MSELIIFPLNNSGRNKLDETYKVGKDFKTMYQDINIWIAKYFQYNEAWQICNTFIKIFFLFFLLQNITFADDIAIEVVPQIQKEDNNISNTIVLGELLLIANAAMAAQAPTLFGGIMLFMAPFGAATSPDVTTETKWTLFVAGEGIAGYNIYAGEKKISKERIFRDNMIAWHLFILSGYISEEIFSDNNKFFGIAPYEDGAQVFISYNF